MNPNIENIKVAVRFRPFNKKESDTDKYIDIENNNINITTPEKSSFTFDYVFDGSSTQEEVYNKTSKLAIELVCQGYNATIFTYGNTGSGKSFSMFGHENNKYELRGIIPRACDDIFNIINNNENKVESRIKCSFLEIYQERIRDLLIPKKGYDPNLKIRNTVSKGVYVQGLVEKFVYCSDDILNIIKEGATQRSVASTSLNSVSSRSHSVLTIFITQVLADGSEIDSKVHLIDLAGSENVGKSEVQGINLSEAKMINKSLSSLGNVINALTEQGREHIPYRDSKLTHLLQDSLGGNSKTIVICTASPSNLSSTETLSTLKFAKRVKEIKNIPKINKNESVTNLLKTIETLNKKVVEYEAIIKAIEENENDGDEVILLRTRNEILENRIEMVESQLSKEKEINTKLEEVLDRQKDITFKLYRKYMGEKTTLNRLETELNHYKYFYNNIKDAKPEIIPLILERTTMFVPYSKSSESILEVEEENDFFLE